MKQATPAIRDLARRLLTLEANGSEHADREARIAVSVFEKLRVSLSKLIGVTGFQALLSRALALAKIELGWLEAVRVKDDATLEGFSETALPLPSEVAAAGSVVLLAQLLGLLVTFVGQDLTLRLLMDVWPNAQLADWNLGTEGVPA